MPAPPVPQPVRINHRLLFAAGTALWVVALVVTAVLFWVFNKAIGSAVWVCATGSALGVVGMVYVRYSWRAKA